MRPTPRSSMRCGPSWCAAACRSLKQHAARSIWTALRSLCLPYATACPIWPRSAPRLAAAPAGTRLRSAALCPRPRFFEMLAARAFPPPPGCAAATRLNTRPSRTFFTMCSATCPCTRILVFADFLAHYGQLCARIQRRGDSGAHRARFLVHGGVRPDSPGKGRGEGLRQRADQLQRRVLQRAGRRLRGADFSVWMKCCARR
jgi:hypothetical protein